MTLWSEMLVLRAKWRKKRAMSSYEVRMSPEQRALYLAMGRRYGMTDGAGGFVLKRSGLGYSWSKP